MLINAFVGGMVGIERTVVPLIGSEEFGIASTTLVVSFIVSFGVVKAFANLVSGQLADTWGRKRVLVLGWLFGLPVPFMIIWAPSWDWIIAANALLGISQGFAWSMTVIMKVDLVGPKGRGLAVGLNEFAGYFAVGVTAFLTGYLAGQYGLRPVPIYLGVGIRTAWDHRSRSYWCATRGIMSGWRWRAMPSKPRRFPSARCSRSPPFATAISLLRRKPGWSTISMTA